MMQVYSLDQIPPKELLPGIVGRLVHSDNMTVAHWDFAPNVDLPSHSHPHEQIINVIRGEFLLRIEGESRTLRGGEVAIIPSGAVHSGRSNTACYIIDVFYPVREDYR